MQVILLERVAKLGQMGDEVNVRDGFARNFLLPQGKALRATDANRARFEGLRADLEARNRETKKEAEDIATRLDGATYVVIRSASDGGALYGSVSPRDIADAAEAEGITVDRRQIVLAAPIKTLGMHGVQVALHPEVSVEITINVARSAEEAALQAQGKTIQDVAAEEEAAANFEIAELFDDMGAAGLDDDPRDLGASEDPREQG